MAPTAQTPGAHNVFIPNTDATNNMVVDFSRNINKFALPRYAQYIPVQKVDGRYIRMTIEVAGRLINTNLRDFVWADGTEAPQGYGNRELFEYQNYRTTRYAFPVPFGELTTDQADWDVLAQHARIMAQLAMTARTQSALTEMDSNISQTATATSIGTGKHDVSTTARKDIKRSFDFAADVIQKATLSAVGPEDLHIVVGSDWARRIAVSQEIVDHIKQSPAAREELEKGLAPNNRFGLPSTLYGYPIEIETTVKVTSRKGVAKVAAYVFDGDTVYMVSRPGGLEGVEGAPSFSTLTAFLKEEMTVESKHDRDNRMNKTRVVDDYDLVVTAPIAGYRITDCLT